ncbi:bifunctional chorismate synthase/flavin reductase [Penicillium hetheringtonii]|uniref:Chorismate synthase n=1 Tax=Penicillium hetheringtonii TaxID=911720 RepID=A0AAD6DID2_9EURO|nr:bifunctional chorismate synthase/flavin reductase [Penicillium hetheringtonii]
MSTWGEHFRVTTYGESHCRSVGCIVDGVPPGMQLTEDDIQPQMTRRRPGQSALTTPRNEKDRVEIQSGTEFGVTLGLWWQHNGSLPRPSHADFTYLEKYGVKASSGGGRSSARETIGRVAAGAIAEKYLKLSHGVEIVCFVSSVEYLKLLETITREKVDQHAPVRCPDTEASERMTKVIEKFRDNHDSIGGTVTCVIRNVPVGLGEPCFDKLEAKLGHAMLSIPATKGFEIGSGFGGCEVPGSIHNDPFTVSTTDGAQRLTTKTNNSGGIQGGISNGASIYFRVAFKPPATIGQAQTTATYGFEEGTLEAKGRHDPCVVPRAVPIVEAMSSLVIMDALMAQYARESAKNLLPHWQLPFPPSRQLLPMVPQPHRYC